LPDLAESAQRAHALVGCPTICQSAHKAYWQKP